MQKHPKNPDGEVGWLNIAVRPSLYQRLTEHKLRIESELGGKVSMNEVLKPMVDAYEAAEALEAAQVTA